MTLTHDALELTIQGPPIPKLCSELVKLGPHHKGTNVFRLALREPLPRHVRPYSTWTSPCRIPPPTLTCSELFIMKLVGLVAGSWHPTGMLSCLLYSFIPTYVLCTYLPFSHVP